MKLHRDPEVDERIVVRPDPAGLVQTKRHLFSTRHFFVAKKSFYSFVFQFQMIITIAGIKNELWQRRNFNIQYITVRLLYP
jgi:hypothetical protein